jgi:hypothetical protein
MGDYDKEEQRKDSLHVPKGLGKVVPALKVPLR